MSHRLRFEECEPRVLLSANEGEFCIPETSSGRLGAIALSIHNYESVHRYLPPAAIYSSEGEPLLSWRVAVLPYVGQAALYEQFHLDESWDSPNNLPLLEAMPEVFVNPHQETLDGETVYQVITGDGTFFPVPEDPPRRHCDSFECGLRIRDVGDGLSHSVLVVESAAEQAVPWTKPADLTFTPAAPLSGLPTAEIRFALGSGEVIETQQTVSPALWSQLITVSDGEFADILDIAEPMTPTASLETLSLAVLNYESATLRFPTHAIYSADLHPQLSWRVSILPYLEMLDLYNEFHLDEPWDSPHNIQLLPKMPRVFAHDGLPDGMTNYLTLVGEGTVFPFATEAPLRGTNFGQIRDGASSTLLIVEADASHAVEWTKPEDIRFDPADPLAGLGDIADTGFHVAMVDARVQRLPANVSPELFVGAALVDDEATLPRDLITGDVNLDGVVDTIDLEVLRANLFQSSPLRFGWKSGDFNGDGVVDGSDFNLWVANQFADDPARRTDHLQNAEPLLNARRRVPRVAIAAVRRGVETMDQRPSLPIELTSDHTDEVFARFGQRHDGLKRHAEFRHRRAR